MIRFNYDQSLRRRLGDVVPSGITPALRLPALAIAIALLVTGTTWCIETQRLATAERDLAALRERAESTAVEARRSQRLHASVIRAEAIRARIAAARADGLSASNAIARVGNALPAGTWLTNIASTQSGEWTIGGRSTHLDEVGTMLRRVQAIDRNAPSKLLSIASTGRSGRILDFVIGWRQHT